jgi:AraC-like DNA-binding protein
VRTIGSAYCVPIMGADELSVAPLPPWNVRSFIGASSDARAIANEAEISARDPETFSASFAHSLLRGVEVAILDAPSHRALRTAKLIAADKRDSVSLVFTRSGSMTAHQDGHTVQARPKTMFLLRSRAIYRYFAPGQVSIVSITIPSSTLPLGLLRNLRTVTATPLAMSVLTRSAIAYIEALVTSNNSPNEVEARQLEQQLLLLVSGLIIENFGSPRRGPATDSAYLAAAVLSISANSSTRGYAPRDVATATGIDLRRLYRIFGAESVSIAELIRDTRLERIALALTDPSNRSLFSDLAMQAGFRGVDQAARAFRRKYGKSMRAYRVFNRP